MFKDNDYSKMILVNISLLTIIAVAYLLNIWSWLILPFVIALLVSFWIISVSWFFTSMGMNKIFSYIFSWFSFFIFFFILWWIINTNINEISSTENLEFYQNRLESLSWPILDYLTKFNINEDAIKQKILKSIDFWELFGNVTWSITFILSNIGLIIIYILFILLEYRFFKEKIWLMSSNIVQRARINSIIAKIKNDVRAYFMIKTLTSFFTGLLTYITLVSFNVDFALFWSFAIFILNFIPTVWSIMGVWLVSIFAIIQIWFTAILLALISILIWIQILIWNIIEPKLMWSKLNLSPLVILLSLWLWGSIWGVVGMLLSVPIMVIINIILSKFDSTKPISILLSEKWVIENEDQMDMEKTREKLFKLLKRKMYKK